MRRIGQARMTQRVPAEKIPWGRGIRAESIVHEPERASGTTAPKVSASAASPAGWHG